MDILTIKESKANLSQLESLLQHLLKQCDIDLQNIIVGIECST